MVEMSRLERLLVNSPVMTVFHRDVLQRRMLALARRPIDGPLLELGVGQGVTTEGLLARVPGVAVTALEYDPVEARRALKRLGTRAQVEEGDATRLRHPDASFGTVVEMNAFHHIPAWRTALGEVRRVLRPGGQFLFTDYTSASFGGVLRHSRTYLPAAFTAEEWMLALEDAGFARIALRGEGIILGRAT